MSIYTKNPVKDPVLFALMLGHLFSTPTGAYTMDKLADRPILELKAALLMSKEAMQDAKKGSTYWESLVLEVNVLKKLIAARPLHDAVLKLASAKSAAKGSKNELKMIKKELKKLIKKRNKGKK